MLYELKTSDYDKVSGIFTKLKNNTSIESIFNGKSEAKILVDSLEKPQSVFIVNSWAYYYLAGSSANEDFNLAIVEYLEGSYFPECIKNKKNLDFAFYPDSEDWFEKAKTLFSKLRLEESGKTYFSYENERFNQNWRGSIPSGYSVKKISRELLDSIKNNCEVVKYIEHFWGTTDQFLLNGFGYCAVDSDDFATICLSVFASKNEREIGIKTFSQYQRRGLAYVTACAYIEECLKNSFFPTWSCFSENEVSVGLAEKLGYIVEDKHPILFASISENDK